MALTLSAVVLGACGSQGESQKSEGPEGPPSAVPEQKQILDGAPSLCWREGDDAVRDLFCFEGTVDVTSLIALQRKLGLGMNEYSYSGGGYGVSSVVALGHSTSLAQRHISPINPRVILIGGSSFLAFNRGVQQVEIASRDRVENTFNFYLVSFEQACNSADGGCIPGDLYTPRIESNWTSVRVEDAEDLKNSPSDCRQCHQRGRKTPVLLMREFDGPWTHFFLPTGSSQEPEHPDPSGADLAQDFVDTKGDEVYGGVPPGALQSTAGLTLQNAMETSQPLVFDGAIILQERWPWSKEGGYAANPSRSALWDRDYELFKRGELLQLPYFAPRPTDPGKQARLSEAYRAYRAGTLQAEELPDLSDVFPDDPQTRAEIGLQVEPNAPPAELLITACGGCHNDVLDQTLSRARFSVDLSRMSADELVLAIARLERQPGDMGRMPPDDRRQLDADGRARLIEYLKNGPRSAEDDATLARAAQVGMAGHQIQDLSGY